MENPQAPSEMRRQRLAEAQCAGKRGRFPRYPRVDAAALILRAASPLDGVERSGQLHRLGSGTALTRNTQPDRSSPVARAHGAPITVDRWRQLERDLHDGVQNELVALIVKLAAAALDPQTPPAVAEMLAGLEARAQGALDSLRNIARGIYPSVLADFGVAQALRSQAARSAIDVTLRGTAPRSSEQAEEAIYFSCLEAIQNAAKHAGRTARVELRLRHSNGRLHVRIADDGVGFDAARTRSQAGLRNIRDRIQDLGGTFSAASKSGCGTVLTLSLPWPNRPDRGQ